MRRLRNEEVWVMISNRGSIRYWTASKTIKELKEKLSNNAQGYDGKEILNNWRKNGFKVALCRIVDTHGEYTG